MEGIFKMKITFVKQVRSGSISLRKEGEKLIVDNELTLDFSAIPDGATVQWGHWQGDVYVQHEKPTDLIVGPILRRSGEIEITLILPISATQSSSVTTFPDFLHVKTDGPIKLPESEKDENLEA